MGELRGERMERQILKFVPTLKTGRGRRLALVLAAAAIVASGLATSVGADTGVRTLYRGQLLPGTEAGRYYCHDLTYPVIRCFDTPDEAEADEAALSRS